MATKSQLINARNTHLAKAHEVTQKASAEGRGLTPVELELVAGHMTKASQATDALGEVLGDEQLLKQLSDVVGPPAGHPRGKGRHGVWAKAMTSHLEHVGAKALTTSGQITMPSLSGGIVATTDRPRSLLNIIPIVPLTTGDTFSFIRETTRTHAASTVAVGKKKPESTYVLEKIEDTVSTIAHLTTVDRSLVMDVELLQEYLEEALRDGVELELEDQVLNGAGDTSGVLDDLTGILNTSGIQAQAWDSDRFVTARKAVTKLENRNLNPAGFAWAMSPNEWESYELAQDTDHFVMSGPGAGGMQPLPIDRAARRLWGYPVVVTTAMADGASVLGDFAGSVEIREREGVVVEWAQTGYMADLFGPGEHGDLYQANKVRFRAEGRWGLAVKRPAGFVEVDLTAV